MYLSSKKEDRIIKALVNYCAVYRKWGHTWLYRKSDRSYARKKSGIIFQLKFQPLALFGMIVAFIVSKIASKPNKHVRERMKHAFYFAAAMGVIFLAGTLNTVSATLILVAPENFQGTVWESPIQS